MTVGERSRIAEPPLRPQAHDWARWAVALLAILATGLALVYTYAHPMLPLQVLRFPYGHSLLAAAALWLAAVLLLGRFLPERCKPPALAAAAALGTLLAVIWMRTLGAWFSALSLLAIAWVVGAAFWPWLRVTIRPSTAHFLRCALGLQVLSLFGYLWSILHLWSLPLALGSALAAAAAAFLAWRRSHPDPVRAPAPPSRPFSTIEWIMACALISLLALIVLLGSLPDLGFDALWSHLLVAQDIAANRYYPDTDVWHTLVPHAVHMIYALGVAMAGMPAATLTDTLLAALMVAGVVAFGAVLYSRAAGLAAAILLVSTPMLLRLSATAYVDVPAMLFALALMIAVMQFVRTGRTGWAALAGLQLGMLVAVKYVGLLFAPVICLIMLLAVLRRNRMPSGNRPLYLFLAAFAISAGVWLARTVWITHSPVFPLLSHLFPSPYWAVGSNMDLDLFGVPRTFLNIVLLPYWVTVHTHWFLAGRNGSAGGLPLLVWPLWLAGFAAFSRGRWLLAVVAFSYLAGQFVVAQYLRYSLSAWPLLSLLAAGALATLWQHPRWLRGMRWSLAAGVALVCGLSLFGWAIPILERHGSLIARRARPDDYLTTSLLGYRTYRYIATHLPPGERILCGRPEQLLSGLTEFAAAYAEHHLVPAYSVTLRDAGSVPHDPDAARLADEHGIRYMLVPSSTAQELAAHPPRSARLIPQYDDGALALLELAPPHEGPNQIHPP